MPKIAGMTSLGEESCRGHRGQKAGKKWRRYIWAAPYPETTVFFYIVQTFFSDEVLKETAFLFFCLSAEGKVRLLCQVL